MEEDKTELIISDGQEARENAESTEGKLQETIKKIKETAV